MVVGVEEEDEELDEEVMAGVEEVGGGMEPEEVESLWEGVQTHTLILPSLWPVMSTLSYTHSGPWKKRVKITLTLLILLFPFSVLPFSQWRKGEMESK